MTAQIYTADDFRTARFAEHPDGLIAMRHLDLDYHPWTVGERYRHCAHSDDDMAAGGWSPVRELDWMTETNLHAAEYMEGRADQAREATPVSLDALRTAWENAEQADECRKGDLLIRRHDSGVYYIIYSAAQSGAIIDARVLSRAPRREPWEELADALWDEGVQSDTEGIARALHERGVRVTGGDDDA